MVNSPPLFEDLKLSDSKGEVDGISEGLAIKGTALSSLFSWTTMARHTSSTSRTPSTYLG
jgi:hypothetical protein